MENLKEVNGTLSINSQQKTPYDLIVFCHLRWDFVYQRPQHIISRLSEDLKVLFVEEPIGFAPGDEGTADIRAINPNLHILQPKVASIEAIGDVLNQHVAKAKAQTAWFYSAAFVPLLQTIDFGYIVYDCMDELSLFKGAPAELLNQERYLMSHADIVFTGGRSLYESKKMLHHNVHCFPSSVDFKHFAKAQNGISIANDIAEIPSPIVGYYGVIDERIDLALVDAAAEANPEMSFVMIGPLAKIGEHDLPKRANIYYPGMRSYDVLPNYLKAFDVAMMPFALNDATKFISPTKTLEYMAAGKPIISTAITDVVRDYSDCVAIVDSAEMFSAALTRAIEDLDHISMTESYSKILQNTSWNSTVANMCLLIEKTVAA